MTSIRLAFEPCVARLSGLVEPAARLLLAIAQRSLRTSFGLSA